MLPCGQRPFILIADDNRDLARGLSILLSLDGFDVEIVHDGREVLKAALARKPAAFLLDIGLPGLSGIEVAAQIRAYPQFDDSLVIAISAYDEIMFQDAPPRPEFDHHLAKPVNAETIFSLLDRLR